MTQLWVDKVTVEKLQAATAGELVVCDENGNPLGWVVARAGRFRPSPTPPGDEIDDDDWPSEEELDRRAQGPCVPAATVEAMLRKLRETHG